jgi:hypothetical protein
LQFLEDLSHATWQEARKQTAKEIINIIGEDMLPLVPNMPSAITVLNVLIHELKTKYETKE